MPLLGYLGFMPFALECAVMYNFMQALEERVLVTRAALPLCRGDPTGLLDHDVCRPGCLDGDFFSGEQVSAGVSPVVRPFPSSCWERICRPSSAWAQQRLQRPWAAPSLHSRTCRQCRSQAAAWEPDHTGDPAGRPYCAGCILKTENRKPKTEKRLYAVSLGCPKNLVDTEIMLGRLTQAGWEVVDTPEAAQLLLVNTCGFIQEACREAVDTILELARHKEADPTKRLAVTGCLVQRYGEALAAELPEVDYFIGVHDFPALVEILDRGPGTGDGRLFHQAAPYGYRDPEARYPATPRHLAYLKIAEGCSHRCTFCVIPSIRGPYRSRPLATLVAEAEALAAAGVKELILVAQDTTAYGLEQPGHPGLPALLRELGQIPEFRWIRLMYGHPARITPQLLETMAAEPRLVPYLDLPIQHGHDEVLKRMGRGYNRQQILDTVRLIRERLPGVTLRTTVMVGFPGETEAHFQALQELIEEVRFDHLGVFLYSPEEGAPASRLRGAGAPAAGPAAGPDSQGPPGRDRQGAPQGPGGHGATGPRGRVEPGVRLPPQRPPGRPGPGHRRPGVYHRGHRPGGRDPGGAPYPGPALRPGGGDCRVSSW